MIIIIYVKYGDLKTFKENYGEKYSKNFALKTLIEWSMPESMQPNYKTRGFIYPIKIIIPDKEEKCK